MNILLFGAPGAGKGTQSALLVSELGMRHISTGDLFRASIKSGTSLGKEAKSYIDQGKLVPDSITIGMVEEEFEKLEGKSFVLDGFPRSVAQAEALDQLLERHDIEIGKALFLEVEKAQIIERLSGRRLCKNCGAVYHVDFNPPKVAGKCDKCGQGPIYQRDDDKKEAIATRLDVYESTTRPLKEYYRKAGLMIEVDGEGDPEKVFFRLKPLLEM